MVTQCPKCQTTVMFEAQDLETGSEVGCEHCDTRLKIKVIPEIIFDSTSSSVSNHTSFQGIKGNILLCIDGEATREAMKALLETHHYTVTDIPSSNTAFTTMKRNPPVLAFIDSGLSDISGAELCQKIKSSPDLSNTIVILLGSMFEKNAKYRQEAPNLAGADDYIDRHEIQKTLLSKVDQHLSRKEETEDEQLEPVHQDSFETLADAAAASHDLEEPISEGELDESSSLVKEARRLARIIVSDIVIYNEPKVEEGLKNENFFELLESEISEGRQLYESRIDKSLHHVGIYKQALEAFLEERGGRSVQRGDKAPILEENPESLEEAKQVPEKIISDVPETNSEKTEGEHALTTEDDAWQTPATPETDTPQDIFQEMEDQAQEIAQKPEPAPALEDNTWISPATSETDTPQDIFQEMENQAQEIAQKSESASDIAQESSSEADSKETKGARRLAKIIVSDIVIYNEEKVEKGLQNGTFYEILADDIQEGRVLFESRVSPELFKAGLYENALEDFIQSRNGTENQTTSDSQKDTEIHQKMDLPEAQSEENTEEKDAKRLAKIIVSDIVIYNEKKVEKGLQNGTFYELLADDIREGTVLYESRVSPQILSEKDYLKEALADFVSQKTASLS